MSNSSSVQETPHPPEPREFPDGHAGWYATEFTSCRAILGDPRFGVQPLRPLGGVDDGGSQAALAGPESEGDLLRIDQPQHGRVRKTVTKYFTVSRVSEHRQAIERIVAERLDAMEELGSPVDFLQVFALPVPSMAICELLGVPYEDRVRFEEPERIVFDFNGTTPDQKQEAMRDVYDYVWTVIEQKRAEPSDDLLSELISSSGLNDDELKGMVFTLFAAGHFTTADMLTRSTWFLLSERDRWETARAHLSSIDKTVEELLRYLNPVNAVMPRTAHDDVEVAGVSIKSGETVAMRTARPSGDLRSDPGLCRFDPSRASTAHLAFGHGRHMCLGQHLARLELQVGLEALMSRFPTLELAVPAEELPWRDTGFSDTLEGLPVAWHENRS